MIKININYSINFDKLFIIYLFSCYWILSLSANAEINIIDPISWEGINSAKQLGEHPVFKIEMPQGRFIAKIQPNATSAKEIYAALIAKEVLTRVEVPNMKILSENERNQFYQRMKELKVSLHGKDIDGDVVIMDFMDGVDLDEGQYLIKSNTGQINLDRLKSLGQLYAYNFFIVGADRFLVKFIKQKDLIYNGLPRNDNIRFSNNTMKIQAIDNTIRDGLKFELEKDTLKAANDHIERIEPQIDELIFALDGDCKITRALETQINAGDLGINGRKAIKDGFVEAIITIGFSEVNFAFLLTKSISNNDIKSSPLLSIKDINTRGYPQFLSFMRQFFKNKAYLSSTIESIKNDEKSGVLISLSHIATKIRLKETIINQQMTFLSGYKRSAKEKILIAKEKKDRKSSLWSKELIKMDDDKDNVNKMTDEEKDQALKNIIKAAADLSVNKDNLPINDELIKDLAYMASSLMLSILK